MIGRIITRGRNSGLNVCLQALSHPFPSLSSLFFSQKESLFTGYETENVLIKAVEIELNQCMEPCVFCFYLTYYKEYV